MSEKVSFVVEQYDNEQLAEANEQLALIIARLNTENANLRKLVRDFDKCLDTALWLASEVGYPIMPDQKLFASLRPRMRKLGIEV